MTAIPSAPPTWRNVFSIPEPTPALSTGTELSAAAVIGVIVIAIPTPPSTMPGSSVEVRRVGLQLREDEQRAADERHARRHQPARAEPIGRSARDRRDEDDQHRHRQERGARPHGAVAEHVLHEQRDEEEHAEHRERDEQRDGVGAGERRVAEQRHVEHRQPLVQLEQHERRSRRRRRARRGRGSAATSSRGCSPRSARRRARRARRPR